VAVQPSTSWRRKRDDLVARCADREEVFAEIPRLPIRTPRRGATIAYVRQRLAENQSLPLLTKALARGRGATPTGEFQKIVRELYDAVERNRYGLKLLDRREKINRNSRHCGLKEREMVFWQR
jgi:hypothetical protein